jgi:hypothetical protein
MADRIVCQTVVELEEKGKSLLSESHNEYLYRLLPSSLFNYWPVISRLWTIINDMCLTTWRFIAVGMLSNWSENCRNVPNQKS